MMLLTTLFINITKRNCSYFSRRSFTTGHSKTVKGLLILDGSEFNKDKAILTGVGTEKNCFLLLLVLLDQIICELEYFGLPTILPDLSYTPLRSNYTRQELNLNINDSIEQ